MSRVELSVGTFEHSVLRAVHSDSAIGFSPDEKSNGIEITRDVQLTVSLSALP